MENDKNDDTERKNGDTESNKRSTRTCPLCQCEYSTAIAYTRHMNRKSACVSPQYILQLLELVQAHHIELPKTLDSALNVSRARSGALRSFQTENILFLKESAILDLMGRTCSVITKLNILTTTIYMNKAYPENNVIRITNLRSNMVHYYNGKQWVITKYNDFIIRVYGWIITLIQNQLGEMNEDNDDIKSFDEQLDEINERLFDQILPDGIRVARKKLQLDFYNFTKMNLRQPNGMT